MAGVARQSICFSWQGELSEFCVHTAQVDKYIMVLNLSSHLVHSEGNCFITWSNSDEVFV